MTTPQDPYGSRQPDDYPPPGQASGSGYPDAQQQGYPPPGSGYPEPQRGYPPSGADYGDTQAYGARSDYPSGQQGWSGGASPSGEHSDQGSRKRPGVVLAATVLWVLTGLFFLLFGVLLMVAGGNEGIVQPLEEAVVQSGVQVDPATLQQGIVITGVVMAVLGALLILGGAFLLRRSNAARILVTVLGVLVALLLLSTVVGTLVVLAAIVLQFLPAANEWFRSRPRAA